DQQALREALQCPVCMSLLYRPITLPNCGHSFCSECLSAVVAPASTRHIGCPVCRAPLG
ncbi:hypothetical protein T484DRAFT_1558391, partial [Baffinella frigidus]